MRIDHEGDQGVIDLCLLARDTFRDHHALFHAFVGQHRATNDIASRIHAGHGSGATVIHYDESALVQLYA